MTESLRLIDGTRGLTALLSRAKFLDEGALVRFQRLPQDQLNVFVTTPFDIIASRRLHAQVSRDGAAFPAAMVQQVLPQETNAPITLGTSMDASWPGALPPAAGFVELDRIPVDVVHQLVDQGRELARQFSGPLGPPKSLLDQTVLEVSGQERHAQIPMRMIFAANALGLVPGIASHPEIPRHLRVAQCGRWTRIDAPFGSVYEHKGLSLLV